MDEEKKLKDIKPEKPAENSGAESKKVEKREKRRSFKSMLGDYKGEYKKIIWPTKTDLVKETVVVIITCVLVGAVITSYDIVFRNGYNMLIDLAGRIL